MPSASPSPPSPKVAPPSHGWDIPSGSSTNHHHTFVSDGRPLLTAGTSRQGVAPPPPTLAPGAPIASVSDGRPVVLSPPSPAVVQHELLACTSPPSQTIAPLPRSAHPIREEYQPSLPVSPSPPSQTVVQHEFVACKSLPSPAVVLSPSPAHPIGELARPLRPTPIEGLVLVAAQLPISR